MKNYSNVLSLKWILNVKRGRMQYLKISLEISRKSTLLDPKQIPSDQAKWIKCFVNDFAHNLVRSVFDFLNSDMDWWWLPFLYCSVYFSLFMYNQMQYSQIKIKTSIQ